MKTIDLFCASPASTAICSSTYKHAIVRHGLRPIEQYRRNTHHFYDKPKARTPIIPCSPQQQPIAPLPYYDYHKIRKSTTSNTTSTNSAKKIELSRRKSSANIDDLYSPPGSSRYLLSHDNPSADFSSESESSHGSALVAPTSSSQHLRPPRRLNNDSFVLTKSFSTRPASSESPVFNSSSSSIRSLSTESPIVKSLRSRPRDQVVELWVSIHCKGCEGKVRKHISRMEGVKSCSIDLATKKVTVRGDVTPLSVLSSISKVKSAQFWPSPTSSSSSPSLPVFRQRY